jgi:hypothetical protein
VAPGDLLMGWIDDSVQGIAFDPSIVTTANQLVYRFCNVTESTINYPAIHLTVLVLRI